MIVSTNLSTTTSIATTKNVHNTNHASYDNANPNDIDDTTK
jgi:hypothetical protein